MFVVFREPALAHPSAGGPNFPRLTSAHEIRGPWAVTFDPKRGGPKSVQFETLIDWTERPEPEVRFFSGTAIYTKPFDLPAPLRAAKTPLWLDLGSVRELAEVRLNGEPLGILWVPPFRVDISHAVRPTGNLLEVEVVNFWPNRIIGDQSLPAEKRLTRTNVRKFTKDTPLMPSGLLGPVTLQSVQRTPPSGS
jgi:hypothetical protein